MMVGSARVVGRIWRASRTVLAMTMFAVVVFAVIVLVVVPRATGAVPLSVLSGSMSPSIPAGSMVIVRPVDSADIDIGDVITYQLRPGDPTLVTHRVVGITYSAEPTFITRGDANTINDRDPVTVEQIRGEVWYSVPFVGHVADRLDGSQRDLLRQGLAGVLLAGSLWCVGGWVRSKRQRPAPADAGPAPWPAPDGQPAPLLAPDDRSGR